MKICGVDFFAGTGSDAITQTCRGGLVIAPSGPGLAGDLVNKPAYRDAALGADLVLPDSGAMVLAWNAMHAFQKSARIERLSGLKFLRLLLECPEIRQPGASLWVMPTPAEADANLAYLRANGFPHLTSESIYLAPFYKPDARGGVEDKDLLAICVKQQPRFLILNVGGGTQEPLGWWLRENLPYRPAIICTGAAIAFLSGSQANIPGWADKTFLGWFARCLREPTKFIPRYWEARHLFHILWKYRDALPPLQPGMSAS